MAYASAHSTSRFDLVAQLRAYGAGVAQAWVEYRQFRTTYEELSALSDRELLDLGVSRHDIRKVAWDSAKAK